MARASFLLKTLARYSRLQSRNCPYCGASGPELLGRKKVLLELRRCGQCLLMYRYPKNEPEVTHAFYQDQYAEGMTTDLPDVATLASWMAIDFVGTEKDLAEKIHVVQSQCPSGRLLDYGCSWGYGVYQFGRAGFDAVGYEIGRPRARFGREQLGVQIIESQEDMRALPSRSFDIVFSNHVLEHLDNPRAAFEDWRRLLKPDGVLFIFVPNAGGKQAMTRGPKWGPMIGEKHSLAIDASFLHRNLPRHGLRPTFSSSPYSPDELRLADDPYDVVLAGDELLALARPCETLTEASRR